MFERLWGRIPAPFTLIFCNDYIFYLKKTKNENEKEFGVGPFFQKIRHRFVEQQSRKFFD